ncbi:hypothetical protein CIB95_12560 [Lottiidibacillus patelloidae]|uniref:CRISPR type III-associated protein domain-containing protein n=1 Tax=Lottiidibacillus patelloidae TaxID=2670334 RepID=A0A263BRB5_9BACI|nr:RAMP superfamily CRISPR-associated protein [Lottiidibacillus patelloidae]OZM56249.1 hypothetical protein CIB95_12560 [Lottiidibacillus patelloidae]
MVFDGRWRKLNSEVVMKLTLSPRSPLLIQAPKEETVGKKEKNNKLYCLTSNGKYYIPGSSIKGVFRSHTEKIFYHLINVEPSSDDNKKKVYQKKEKDKYESIEFYDKLNPINQLFGHSVFRGRLTVEDAMFNSNTVSTDTRTNIAIDRFRGGSKNGALFETECITKGDASTTVHLKNPEEWQIVWLCFLIRDLQKGNLSIGAKSSIGFGEVNVGCNDISINVYNQNLQSKWGTLLEKAQSKKEGVYNTYSFETLDTLANYLETNWTDFLKQVSDREEVEV